MRPEAASRLIAPARALARTAVFFARVLPMVPSRPIEWITPQPVIERVRYPTTAGHAEGHLYRPPGPGPHPAMVVCLGVVPFEVNHPQVPRLGDALARSGFAALLYWSPSMRDQRLDPDDTRNIALAYDWLVSRPTIDASRSGLLGTCVGGSFALLAAAEASIRDRVSFVVAWAPFSSMWTMTRDIASASTTTYGTRHPWRVDQLTRAVFVRSLTGDLEADEAERLRTICAQRGEFRDIPDLSPHARAIHPLLTALDVVEADAALNRLPNPLKHRLDAMSPVNVLADIQAPLVILAHDRDDEVVPIGESRRLRAALEGRPGVLYTEFTMFRHLDPAKVSLPKLALARELVSFLRTVYPLFRATERHFPRRLATPRNRER